MPVKHGIAEQSYRDALLSEMTQRLRRSLTPSVQSAFSRVPRDLFVTSYYEQQGNSRHWQQITAPPLERIYRDEALTTSIDRQGLPDSSSSQPSIMAAQLEALDLHAGQQVLEIGTGTGYNAALMGQMIAPDGQVISVDINETCVHSANRHLQQAGYENVLALVGDGFMGEPSHAPYDRLLATCSVHALPSAWLQQVKHNGVIVCNVLLNLASLFVRLEKTDAYTFKGRLLPLEARYMEIQKPHQEIQGKRRGTKWTSYDILPHYDIPLIEHGRTLLDNPAYCLLLHCLQPTLNKHYRWMNEDEQMVLYLLDSTAPHAAVQVHHDRLTVYGEAQSLAMRICESMVRYRQLGQPQITDYVLHIHNGQTTCTLSNDSFPLLLVAQDGKDN